MINYYNKIQKGVIFDMVHKSWKKAAIIMALGLLLTVLSPIANVAAATNDAAAKLSNALKAMNIGDVGNLYDYLQSIEITDSEYNSIISNAEKAKAVIGNKAPADLNNEAKAEISRLLLDSAQKAHLQVAFVDGSGKAIDLTNIDLSKASAIKLQIKDTAGNVLAVVDPKQSDLAPAAISQKVESLKVAVEAKKELDKAGKYVPMPSNELPNTATELPMGILVGSLLVVLGGIALIPSVRAVRRMGNQA